MNYCLFCFRGVQAVTDSVPIRHSRSHLLANVSEEHDSAYSSSSVCPNDDTYQLLEPDEGLSSEKMQIGRDSPLCTYNDDDTDGLARAPRRDSFDGVLMHRISCIDLSGTSQRLGFNEIDTSKIAENTTAWRTGLREDFVSRSESHLELRKGNSTTKGSPFASECVYSTLSHSDTGKELESFDSGDTQIHAVFGRKISSQGKRTLYGASDVKSERR